MAAQNTVFEDVAKSVFMYSCNKDVLEQCRKVEYDQKYVKHLKDENKSLKASNTDKDIQISELEASNTDKDIQISELEAKVVALKAELDKTKQ